MEKTPMFLTHDEISTLTGRKTIKDQVVMLSRKGYPFEVDYKGRPVVLRSMVEERLGLKSAKTKTCEPNFGALKEIYDGQKKRNR